MKILIIRLYLIIILMKRKFHMFVLANVPMFVLANVPMFVLANVPMFVLANVHLEVSLYTYAS